MLGVVKRYPMPVFFGLACAFAWACWIPLFAVLKPASPNDPAMLLSLLGTLGPGLAAWFVTRRVHGKAGSRALWRQLRRWHVGAQWYAVALLLTPALLALATGMQRMIGGEVPPYPWVASCQVSSWG